MKLSPRVLDKISAAFADLGMTPDDDHIVRDIVRYAIEIFREDWDRLHETPDGVRVYDFFGNDVPRVIFYGVLRSTSVYDFAIVEELVEIFDADVIVEASSGESE